MLNKTEVRRLEREEISDIIEKLIDKNRNGGKYPGGDFDNGYDVACRDLLLSITSARVDK